MKALSEQFKVKIENVMPAIEKQTAHLAELRSEHKQLKKELVLASLSQLADNIDTSGAFPTLCIVQDNLEGEHLRTASQSLAQQSEGFFFIAANNHEKKSTQFIAVTTPTLHDRISHKELTLFLKECELRGGGKPGTIQGGGALVTPEILSQIKRWISQK